MPDIIIDIGSGRSSYLNVLEGLKSKVLALDIDVNAIRENPAEMKIVADAQYIPLRRGVGEKVLVLLFSILEHLPNFHKTLYSIDGFFLIQIPNLKHLIEAHTALPLLYYYPEPIRGILAHMVCCYINWKATPHNIVKILKARKYKVKIIPYVYSEQILFPKLQRIFKILTKLYLPHGFMILALYLTERHQA